MTADQRPGQQSQAGAEAPDQKRGFSLPWKKGLQVAKDQLPVEAAAAASLIGKVVGDGTHPGSAANTIGRAVEYGSPFVALAITTTQRNGAKEQANDLKNDLAEAQGEAQYHQVEAEKHKTRRKAEKNTAKKERNRLRKEADRATARIKDLQATAIDAAGRSRRDALTDVRETAQVGRDLTPANGAQGKDLLNGAANVINALRNNGQ